MTPLPSMLTQVLPGAVADPGLSGRFHDAADGGGAFVLDRDGFAAELQAASAAGSLVLTAGLVTCPPAKPAEALPGASTSRFAVSAPETGAVPVPGPAAHSLDQVAMATSMANLAPAELPGGRSEIRTATGAEHPRTAGRSADRAETTKGFATTPASSGASTGPASGTGSEVGASASAPVRPLPLLAPGFPGAAASALPAEEDHGTPVGRTRVAAFPSDGVGAPAPARRAGTSEVASSGRSPWTETVSEVQLDVAGRITDATRRVLGVLVREDDGPAHARGSAFSAPNTTDSPSVRPTSGSVAAEAPVELAAAASGAASSPEAGSSTRPSALTPGPGASPSLAPDLSVRNVATAPRAAPVPTPNVRSPLGPTATAIATDFGPASASAASPGRAVREAAADPAAVARPAPKPATIPASLPSSVPPTAPDFAGAVEEGSTSTSTPPRDDELFASRLIASNAAQTPLASVSPRRSHEPVPPPQVPTPPDPAVSASAVPAPAPEVRAEAATPAASGVDPAASPPDALVVVAPAHALGFEAPSLRAAIASLGRASELASPVTLPSLPSAVPYAVKLALHEGESEVRIRLWPPELGSIVVRLRITGVAVSARIEAERTDVRGLLESMRPEFDRGMQEAGLKLARLEFGPAPASETHRAWEGVISASAAPASGGGGIQERQAQGATSGSPGPSGGFDPGGFGPRGEHAAGGRADSGREGTALRPENRSDSGESGPRDRGLRGAAAIDAWA